MNNEITVQELDDETFTRIFNEFKIDAIRRKELKEESPIYRKSGHAHVAKWKNKNYISISPPGFTPLYVDSSGRIQPNANWKELPVKLDKKLAALNPLVKAGNKMDMLIHYDEKDCVLWNGVDNPYLADTKLVSIATVDDIPVVAAEVVG